MAVNGLAVEDELNLCGEKRELAEFWFAIQPGRIGPRGLRNQAE